MVTVSIQNNPSNLDTNGIDKSVHIVEQVKAMRGGFNRRFGRGGAHTFRHRGRPTPNTETNSKLVHVCVKDIYQNMLISQITHLGVCRQTTCGGRKTERSHKHLEGDNKRPMGVKHLNWLSDRFAVGTPARGMPTHSTILVEQSQLIVEEVQKL